MWRRIRDRMHLSKIGSARIRKEGPMTIYTVVTASHRERRPSPIF
jgi:hypothetical protein